MVYSKGFMTEWKFEARSQDLVGHSNYYIPVVLKYDIPLAKE